MSHSALIFIRLILVVAFRIQEYRLFLLTARVIASTRLMRRRRLWVGDLHRIIIAPAVRRRTLTLCLQRV